MENRSLPVIPLPNPGEGGAVAPGTALPGEGQIPVVPLPNPGEGGAVNPGVIPQPLPGYIVAVPARYAAARFLNATYGYPALRIDVDGARAVTLLDSGTASGYVRIPAGLRTVTVYGEDGYIYVEKALRFASGSTSTVAIVNRAGGMDLTQVADACRVI